MNLEKAINKNMFDVSTSIRETNPLPTPDLIKNEQHDTTSSILSNPKQKLTAQFKRAITMIKQRSEPTDECSSPQFLTSISLTDKPTHSLDSNLLTSLTEEPSHNDLHSASTEMSTPKSQSFIHIQPSVPNRAIDLNTIIAPTVITLDPTIRVNHQNESLLTNRRKPSLQQIHSSINQQTISPETSSSSSATLSPTSSSSTTNTG